MCSIAARHNNILKAEEILHTSRSGGGLIYTLLHKLVNQQAVDTAGRQQASHNTESLFVFQNDDSQQNVS